MAINIAFTLIMVVGVLAGLATLYFSIRLPFHGKSENLHGWFRLNPFNAVFSPGKLTATGLVLRRRLLFSAGCFFACGALGAVLGRLAKSLE